MRFALLACLLLLCPLLLSAQETKKKTPTIADKTSDMVAADGYFKYYWSEKEGKIYLEVDQWEEEFLYVNSLPAGLGSNDIGLDRNQLGDSRIVKFVRSGPKVIMVQPNYDYRAITDNVDEQKSVTEAFAQSAIAGFTIEAETDKSVLIDLTPFLLRDAHEVTERLKQRKEGTYKEDPKRSYIYLDRTKNFPKNTEFEAVVTLAGEASGRNLRSVVPSTEAISLRQHHSFVELPDAGYKPRVYHAQSGYSPMSYADYATPIDQPLMKRFIRRHRLQKKNPEAAVSEAIEPIIYYLDRGTPEPIRSALLEGARWWNQAYEAAGYKDAFQVKVLPAGADPMDVRYNLINWVHRSTRGWSYGSSVTDPRTGEIIKGHVLLGSLRIRQDFLIAQGLVSAYAENGTTPDPRLQELALARLRQLSAHEVGHTLGLTHNFSASVNDRASVMDYPHPYIALDNNGDIDFSQAYTTGIGDWDKQAIIYGYQDFPKKVNESAALLKVVEDTRKKGLLFLSDGDARPISGASPSAHLWDNGQTPTDELQRMHLLRRKAMLNFNEKNIPLNSPLANLENVFVPLYLMHRYEVEAVAKMIGGVDYSYSYRGDGSPPLKAVDTKAQTQALAVLISTLQPDFLRVPDHIRQMIPPQPIGYRRDRELFNIQTGLTFDPMGMAEASADYTLLYLLNTERLARLLVPPVATNAPQGLRPSDVIKEVHTDMLLQQNKASTNYDQQLAYMVEKRLQQHLIRLAANQKGNQQISAVAWAKLHEMAEQLNIRLRNADSNPAFYAHLIYLQEQFKAFQRDPKSYEPAPAPKLPDGSPIGCGE